jgi:hypothetical protein
MRTLAFRPGVLRTKLDDQEVLLNEETGMYHLLNATGRELLERVEAGATLDEAEAAIAEASDVPIEVVRRDSEAFLDALRSRGLLVEPDPG